MESKPRTVRQTDIFHAACKRRAKHLKYRSFSAYMNGLARYDLMIQKPHSVTGPISKAAPDVQEAIDRGILSGQASDNSKISYLEHLVADTTSVIGRRIVEEIERELGRLTVAQAEQLVSLPATGQEIVVETLLDEQLTGESVESVVRKAKNVAAEGVPLTKTALKQSVRRVTEELAKLRQVLKLKRLHASLGPENLRLLLSDKTFRKVVQKEKINVSKFEEII